MSPDTRVNAVGRRDLLLYFNLATQTCLGAGRMLVSSPEQPEQLRRNVTSPNGTTHAAIESFKAAGLEQMVDQAVRAAVARSEELGKAMAA